MARPKPANSFGRRSAYRGVRRRAWLPRGLRPRSAGDGHIRDCARSQGAGNPERGVTRATAGDERVIFSGVMLVRQLPPGHYVCEPRVGADAPVKTMLREFEVAPPRVLMTSVEAGTPPAAGPAELFLPAGDELFARPFTSTPRWEERGAPEVSRDSAGYSASSQRVRKGRCDGTLRERFRQG